MVRIVVVSASVAILDPRGQVHVGHKHDYRYIAVI